MRFRKIAAAIAISLASLTSIALAQTLPASTIDVDAMVSALSTSASRGFGAQIAQLQQPSVSLRVKFELGSAVLTPEAKRLLTDFTQVLNHHKLLARTFEIVGHTDARGSETSNQTLSEARAQAVVDFLSDDSQVAAWRMNSIGKGETQLLLPEDPNDENNRRVEIIAK